MSVPSSPTPVPPVVRRFAAGRPVRAVWVNDDGAVTFRLGEGVSGVEYVKAADADTADFGAEVARLRWASRYAAVPRVLGFGVERGVAGDAGNTGDAGDIAWLRTRGLPGLSAVHPRWLASPESAVRAIGTGLRMLHDRLPVRACPFDWSVAGRLARLGPGCRECLGEPPPVDRLVVCHGDACAPNTLIGDDGRCCGHVDLGDLGVADRWADLAVATMSLGWNYPGGGWDEQFFAAYGVAPDPVRIDYYRRLWNAGGTPRTPPRAKLGG